MSFLNIFPKKNLKGIEIFAVVKHFRNINLSLMFWNIWERYGQSVNNIFSDKVLVISGRGFRGNRNCELLCIKKYKRWESTENLNYISSINYFQQNGKDLGLFSEPAFMVGVSHDEKNVIQKLEVIDLIELIANVNIWIDFLKNHEKSLIFLLCGFQKTFKIINKMSRPNS